MKHLLLAFFLSAAGLYTNAQVTITNSGNLTIHPGASISFFGDLTNTSSGNLLNNGHAYAKGNLTSHQASMNAGNGTLTLNGSTLQAINGSQLFKTTNLVTDNSSGIHLNNDLSVGGVHTFSAGKITASTLPNYFIYEDGASYSGANDSRHINGWVQKAGSTDFYFPVGNGSVTRPIGITNLSGSSVFAANYQTTTPYTSQVQGPLVSINPNEYWQINKVSGGNAVVSMNWNNSKTPFMSWMLSEIRVATYNGSYWVNAGGSANGNVATTGTITSDPVSSFNLFTLGSLSAVLPLSLLDFDAKRVNNYTQVTWKTDKEENVDHFSVDRSDNGVLFYGITKMQARNSGRLESYSFQDKKPISNHAFYRLKSVDIDGSSKFSKVVRVSAVQTAVDLSLLTNPVQEKLTLVPGNELSGEFQYLIISSNGQMMQQGTIIIHPREHALITFKGLMKPGTYILNLKSPKQSLQIKFIVP